MGKKKLNKKKDKFIINNIYPYNFKKTDYFFWPTIYYKIIMKNIKSFEYLLISKEEKIFLNSLINRLDLEINKNIETIEIFPLYKEIIEKMKIRKVIFTAESLNIQKIIDSFPPSKTFYISDISSEYIKLFKKKLSRNRIYNILKNSLKYRFIKTSIKPNKITSERGKIMSFLFYKTILRALFLGMQPIYIDESGFQLFNNKYYRWRKREEDFPYGSDNNILKKSNMILAITDNNILFYQINNENTNKKIFLNFLIKMIEKIPESEKENKLVIMDNAKFHFSDEIKTLFEKNKIKVLTISPYNSDQNMCELVFRHLKLKIRKINFKTHKKMVEKLNDILGDENICNLIKKLFRSTLIYYRNIINKNNDYKIVEASFNKLFKNN